jgi:hypothetical protein
MHSCIDIEFCDSTRMVDSESIANDSDCMAAILSAAVGLEGNGLCLCSFGDGLH